MSARYIGGLLGGPRPPAPQANSAATQTFLREHTIALANIQAQNLSHTAPASHSSGLPESGSENSECPVCYESFVLDAADAVQITGVEACKHIYCLKCVTNILNRDPGLEKKCPLCRTVWVAGPPESLEDRPLDGMGVAFPEAGANLLLEHHPNVNEFTNYPHWNRLGIMPTWGPQPTEANELFSARRTVTPNGPDYPSEQNAYGPTRSTPSFQNALPNNPSLGVTRTANRPMESEQDIIAHMEAVENVRQRAAMPRHGGRQPNPRRRPTPIAVPRSGPPIRPTVERLTPSPENGPAISRRQTRATSSLEARIQAVRDRRMQILRNMTAGAAGGHAANVNPEANGFNNENAGQIPEPMQVDQEAGSQAYVRPPQNPYPPNPYPQPHPEAPQWQSPFHRNTIGNPDLQERRQQSQAPDATVGVAPRPGSNNNPYPGGPQVLAAQIAAPTHNGAHAAGQRTPLNDILRALRVRANNMGQNLNLSNNQSNEDDGSGTSRNPGVVPSHNSNELNDILRGLGLPDGPSRFEDLPATLEQQQRETAVALREQDLERQRNGLNRREATLRQGEAQLQNREQAIQEREEAIDEREEAIDEREEAIDRRTLSLNRQAHILHVREQVVNEREQAVNELEQALYRRQNLMGLQQERMEQHAQAMDLSDRAVDQQTRLLDQRAQALNRREQDVQRREQTVQRLEQALQRQQQQPPTQPPALRDQDAASVPHGPPRPALDASTISSNFLRNNPPAGQGSNTPSAGRGGAERISDERSRQY